MKNIGLALFSTIIIFTACSKEDDPIYEPTLARPKALKASHGEFLDKISLSWTSLSPKALKFDVFRYDETTSDYLKIGETNANTFEDTTITQPYEKHYYKVRVYNSEKEFSKLSDSAHGYIEEFKSVEEISSDDHTMARNSLYIQWNDVKFADGYEVYRSKSDTLNFEKVHTNEWVHYKNDYSYLRNYYYDIDYEPKTEYYYKVRAFNNKFGVSNFSETVLHRFVLPQAERPWNQKDMLDCFYQQETTNLQIANQLIGKWKWIYSERFMGNSYSIGVAGFDPECQNIEVEFLDDYTLNIIQDNEVKSTTKWELKSRYANSGERTLYYLKIEDFFVEHNAVPRSPEFIRGIILFCDDKLEFNNNIYNDGWVGCFTRVQ